MHLLKNWHISKDIQRCDDFVLSNRLVEDIWGWFSKELFNYSIEGDKNLPSPVSIMHTNSGAGKILDMAPDNSNITAYNLGLCMQTINRFSLSRKKCTSGYIYQQKEIFHNFLQ